MKFRVKTKEGERVLTIKEIEDNRVTVDMNHPFAGKTLYFDVSIIDVREEKKEQSDSDE